MSNIDPSRPAVPRFGQELHPTTALPCITDPTQFQRQVLHAAQPVLVKFSIPMCSWCEEASPALVELAQAFEGKIRVVEVRMGTRANPSPIDIYKETYQLPERGYPTFSLFRQGKEAARLNVTREIFENLSQNLRDRLILPNL